jgi:hypothetical protein
MRCRRGDLVEEIAQQKCESVLVVGRGGYHDGLAQKCISFLRAQAQHKGVKSKPVEEEAPNGQDVTWVVHSGWGGRHRSCSNKHTHHRVKRDGLPGRTPRCRQTPFLRARSRRRRSAACAVCLAVPVTPEFGPCSRHRADHATPARTRAQPYGGLLGQPPEALPECYRDAVSQRLCHSTISLVSDSSCESPSSWCGL